MIEQNYFRQRPYRPFANPTVDAAFKRIFGTDTYKQATIGFLRSLLPERDIRDVEFLNGELLAPNIEARKAFVDVLCKTPDEQFLVEMQNVGHSFFRQRMVYYSSMLIANSGQPGPDWDFNLTPTYVIAIMNFELGVSDTSKEFISHCVCRDEVTREKLPGSTEYFFLSLKKFDKSLDEITSGPEFWLYLLNHSKEMNEVPQQFAGDESFRAYFEASVLAGFTKEEREIYDKTMTTQNDINIAMRENFAKGKAEGKAEVAARMKSCGLPLDDIAKFTGLSVEVIQAL